MKNRTTAVWVLVVSLAGASCLANPVPLFPGFAVFNANSSYATGSAVPGSAYIGDTVISGMQIMSGSAQFSIAMNELCSGKLQFAPLPEWFAIWAGLPMVQSYTPLFSCSLFTGSTAPQRLVGTRVIGNESGLSPRAPFLVRLSADIRLADSLFIRITPIHGIVVWRFTVTGAPSFVIGQCTPAVWSNGAYGVCSGDTIRTDLSASGFIDCMKTSLSLDSGVTWSTITPVRLKQTFFSWIPPDTSTYRALIRCIGAPPGYDSVLFRDTAYTRIAIVHHGTRPGVEAIYGGADFSFCHACTTGPPPDSLHAFTDSTWARLDSLDFDNVEVRTVVLAADAAGGTRIAVEIRRDSLHGVLVAKGDLPRNFRRTMLPVLTSLKGVQTVFITLVADTATTAQLRLLMFTTYQPPLAIDRGHQPPVAPRVDKSVWTIRGHRTLTIFYAIGIPGESRLIVRDLNGRIIRHLQRGYEGAGVHSVIWNRRNDHAGMVGPGTYVLEIAGASGMTNTLIHIAR